MATLGRALIAGCEVSYRRQSRLFANSTRPARLTRSGHHPLTLFDHRSSAVYRATVARNLVFKALSETASGETRATRIVGQREALEAAE